MMVGFSTTTFFGVWFPTPINANQHPKRNCELFPQFWGGSDFGSFFLGGKSRWVEPNEERCQRVE